LTVRFIGEENGKNGPHGNGLSLKNTIMLIKKNNSGFKLVKTGNVISFLLATLTSILIKILLTAPMFQAATFVNVTYCNKLSNYFY
jgi:hypothetical protein